MTRLGKSVKRFGKSMLRFSKSVMRFSRNTPLIWKNSTKKSADARSGTERFWYSKEGVDEGIVSLFS